MISANSIANKKYKIEKGAPMMKAMMMPKNMVFTRNQNTFKIV